MYVGLTSANPITYRLYTSTEPVLPSNLDSLLAVVDTSLVSNYLLIMGEQWEALLHYSTNIIDSFINGTYSQFKSLP